MIVVSDTSPINYLIQIGSHGVLGALFQTIWVPESVVTELRDRDAPASVRDWAGRAHPFLRIHPDVPAHNLAFARALHRGEEHAIGLALHLNIPAVLMDDLDARRAASSAGLVAVGTLRILANAALAGLISIEPAFERLSRTNFRASPQLYKALLDEISKRR